MPSGAGLSVSSSPFVPLYMLGFMGMTRRVSQQIDPEYQHLLFVAAGGAVVILFGIIFQLLQLVVISYSVRNCGM